VFNSEVAVLVAAGIGVTVSRPSCLPRLALTHLPLPGHLSRPRLASPPLARPNAQPFASILKHIWYRQRAGTLGRLRRVEFVWSCRETGSFGWIHDLLEELEGAQMDDRFLRISVSAAQGRGPRWGKAS
jgi:hypothetical protein